MNNSKRNYWIAGVIVLLLLIGSFFLNSNPDEQKAGAETDDSSLISPYGTVTLRLGETAKFDGISITPTAVKEDSRCPQGVECIWAGTVRIDIDATLDDVGDRTITATLGETIAIGDFAISLLSVEPQTKAGQTIDQEAYRFTVQVNQGTDEGLEGFESKG